jgi:hypothetical protein
MNGKIFISYRRAETAGHAQNLHHRLASWFDDGDLFFDAEHMESGRDFPQRLANELDIAAVVLVLIGPTWVEEINRRASQPAVDFVRQEVEHALQRLHRGDDVRVIPVLLGGATMPSAESFSPALKDALGPLCRIDTHAFVQGKQDDWDYQFVRLRELLAASPNAPQERYRDRSGQPRPWRVLDHALSASFQDPNGLIDALRGQLQRGGSAALVGAGGSKAAALHGMGGIGKTQLALAYCHRYRDAYAGVWWFRAETTGESARGAPSSLNDTLLQQDALGVCAAAGVAVPDGMSPSQAFSAWLGGQTVPWLLVFDNADDPKSLRPHLPGSRLHHTLITSRRPDWGALAKTVELPTWTVDQGASFLARRLGQNTPKADAGALSEALGGLPLALEQAASYIEVSGATVAHYLGLWQTAAAQLLDQHAGATGYERTVATTLSLAFQHLSPAAQQLLRLCAFAAPEPVPERFFAEARDHLPPELRAAAANPLDWDGVTGELNRYALAHREPIPSLERVWRAGSKPLEGSTTELALTFHRLTLHVVRDRFAASQDDRLATLALMRACCPSDVEDPRHWPRLAAWLPHAMWLSDSGPGAATQDPEGRQTKRWLLVHAAGFSLYGLALYPQARSMYEQALIDSRDELGEDHLDTLVLMDNLSAALLAFGDPSGARRLEEKVLIVRRREFGREHPGTLTTMNNLAEAIRGEAAASDRTQKQRLLTEAHGLHEQVLAGRRRILPKDDSQVLVSINNLAEVLRDKAVSAAPSRKRRILERVRTLQQHVLAVWRCKQGKDHPNTLSAMNNLSGTLRTLGDRSGACDLRRVVFEIRLRSLGDKDPRTLTSMNNYAISLQDVGEQDAAVEMMTRAADGRSAVFGREHARSKESFEALARIRGQDV